MICLMVTYWRNRQVQLDSYRVSMTLLTIIGRVIVDSGLVKFYLGYLRFKCLMNTYWRNCKVNCTLTEYSQLC